MSTSDSHGPPTLDRIFEALSHPTRRRILTAVAERNSATDELSSATLEPTERSREQFDIALKHRHLPHLADADLIAWDRGADTIARGPAFEAAAPLIEQRNDLPHSWP